MDLERIVYQKDGKVAIIKINYPPANTLGSKTIEELDVTFNKANNDPDIKAIVLTGEGKIFIAGADLKEINSISAEQDGEKMALAGQRVFDMVEGMKKPVIAAINGACLGGGMELAMACHIRVASESAKFGQPEINLGLIPGFGGTQRLARLTNKSIALEWILTGDMHTADDAFRLGLVNKVVPTEKVVEEALNLAKKIAEKSGVAISMAIEAINTGLESNQKLGLEKEASLFGRICSTEDKKEGVQAFLEKRAPIFKDR